MNRRHFLQSAGALGLAAALPPSSQLLFAAPPTGKRLRMAVVTTIWYYGSHAWHMPERFLHGYPMQGHWHHPQIDVVSAYIDQIGDNDLGRSRAQEFGFTIYPTVAEALRCGKDKLDVDCVLLIGEHGDYPKSDIGQTKYPRYELFKQITKVYREDGRTAPIFNDKHLSWHYPWAVEMVEDARELKFPFLAGSSLPVTFRMPSIDMPYGAEVEEAMSVAVGGPDSYDFHALETIQCMVERRKGGETGVVSMHSLRGQQVWDAMETGSWSAGGWDPALFEACLSRSHMLAQSDKVRTSDRYPTKEQMHEWVKDPIAYRFEYADGLKATMLLMNGVVGDFNFAARLKGGQNISTLFQLPPNPNVVYSAALMSKAEEMFFTGKPPYPIERTLLTTGLTQAGVQSLSQGKKLETPHLNVKYQSPRESLFWQA
ncbi:MAG: twin-arginine translocation signal domain-containing protein [Planctomycetaceae bacterium]